MFRLVGFEARDFRSLKRVSLGTLNSIDPEPLPSVVLIYGLNDVGKSNILRAVECWCVLARAFLLEQPPSNLVLPLEEGVDPWNALPDLPLRAAFRDEMTQLTLSGELSLKSSTGAETSDLFVTLTFELELDFSGPEDRPQVEARLVKATYRKDLAPSSTRNMYLLPGLTDKELLDVEQRVQPAFDQLEASRVRGELKKVLKSPWVRLGADRRWHQEAPLEQSRSWSWLLPADGRDLKTRLFRARNSTERKQRDLFSKTFGKLIEGEPFLMKEPSTSLNEQGKVELLIDDKLIEQRGSGPQQWTLMASMLSLSGAGIAGVEEPEINMAWGAQQSVCRMLLEAVRQNEAPWQLWVTSHSPVMFELHQNAPNNIEWFQASREDQVTTITRWRGKSSEHALMEIIPWMLKNPRLPKPGSVLLYPQNFIQLGDDAIETLQVKTGHPIEYVCKPASFSIELFGPKGCDIKLGLAEFDEAEVGE